MELEDPSPVARSAALVARRVVDEALRVVVRRALVAVRLAPPAAREVVLRAALVALLAPPPPSFSIFLVRSSIRFCSFARSAWLAVRFSCAWTCFMLAETVFSNDRPVASMVLRRSGGTRFWTSRSASRPALTAWLMKVPREAELLEDEP